MRYNHGDIEQKWQQKWIDDGVHKLDLRNVDEKKKCYCLVMFSYPSGDKLHNGHWFNFGPTDSWARFKTMNGYNVFEPMGFDAFGLPAENYAIKHNVHPKDSTEKNIKVMTKQLKAMGAMYDWDHTLSSHEPSYYKWTQWLFLKLYEKGLAYKAEAPVNWCDSCQTVLANEQVVDGLCDRCDTEVYKKNLSQWFFKITDYSEKLLQGHADLDWPSKTIAMQKNWIGKSVGAQISFKVADKDLTLDVFTTRPDTLYGVTYASIAPEHPEVLNLTTPEKKKEVEDYITATSKMAEVDRLSTEKEKTGVFTGSYVINPVNGEKVELWVADYVLYSYGTGVVMAVPAHDERDFAFAKKFNLPMKKVILEKGKSAEDELTEAYTEVGAMINSAKYDGMKSNKALKSITYDLNQEGLGEGKTTYRLRDWLVSRQRYWGAPIPIVYCDDCGEVPVPEKDLPIELPYEVTFTKDGKSPLSTNESFWKTTCPKCNKEAKREVDTLDTFVCSSWYYLRYPDNKNSEKAFDLDLVNKMLPVDKYVGGPEHACMHLLYARFITMALHDMGILKFKEPFKSLTHQGIILAPDGKRMSKSKGNTISPDPYIEKHGADVFRCYLMFGFNYVDGGPWEDTGLKAVAKFVDRIWDMAEENLFAFEKGATDPQIDKDVEKAGKTLLAVLHNSIKGVTEDTEKFQFNTSIARQMELINAFRAYNNAVPKEKRSKELVRNVTENMLLLLAPFAPHVTEELWEKTSHTGSIFSVPWPKFEAKHLVKDEVVMVVQVNGKIRAELEVPADSTDDFLKKMAQEQSNVQKYMEGKQVVKIIVIKKKLINIVVK